jgi:galactose-1-phosphate uridylyltransferase
MYNEVKIKILYKEVHYNRFHPHSDVTLPIMSHKEVRNVIDKWTEINVDLGKKYNWVQVR